MKCRSPRTIALAIFLSAFFASFAHAQTRFTDDANRNVVLPKNVTRLFAAGAPAEVLLYTLAPEKMVGRNHLPSQAALEYMPAELRSPVAISKLPRSQDASNDTELIALKPDVYVDYGDLHPDYITSVSNVQERTGIPGIILDGRLEAVSGVYRRLGAALQEKQRGNALAKEVDALLKKYRGILSKAGDSRRVYLACSADGMIPCLAGERNGEIAEFLGAKNVAGRVGGPIKPLSMDEIKAWNPEIIIATNSDAASRLLRDPDWQSIKAVSDKRVFAAPTQPFNWGSRPPSVNRLPGMIWLAYVLRGREFDAAFYSDIRSFFAHFYHVQLSNEQLQKLVRP